MSSQTSSVKPAPLSAAQSLEGDAKDNGGPFALDPEYVGAFGRTLFDDRSSKDGTVSVVMPADAVGQVPTQSLIRVHSISDGREYIAAVTEGPYCEPDGLPASSPQLVVPAVRGAMNVPRHHGRLQATIIGEKTAKGMVPARYRPRPNSPTHMVPSAEVAEFLNLRGEMRLGHLYGHEDVEIRISPKSKSVLPRHSAHIGTTGGGKSTGVGRTVFEMQKAGLCVVLFDVEGEYTALDQPTNNEGLVEVLSQRGLEPAGVQNVHLYRLVGCQSANPDNKRTSHTFHLSFDQISPFAFGEILDLSDAQNERLFQAYEVCKGLLRDFGIFPSTPQDQKLLLDVDEFDRGWPKLRLEDLRYVVSAVIQMVDKVHQGEPPFTGSSFHGRYQEVKTKLHAFFGAGDDEGGKGKKSGPKMGSSISWKALMMRLSRLARLKIFDSKEAKPIDYKALLAPGRVNIIDLSDLENNDVRNLAIAELLRGILDQQQALYDQAVASEKAPLSTNVLIEEAHEFLSARRISKMPILREQLMKIAKRGRKRHLGLTFITQSPGDLPDDVLGLVNNWVIYKIDQSTVSRLKSYVPNTDDSLWGLMRGLGPGQAMVSFTHVRRSVIAAIDPSPAKLLMTE